APPGVWDVYDVRNPHGQLCQGVGRRKGLVQTAPLSTKKLGTLDQLRWRRIHHCQPDSVSQLHLWRMAAAKGHREEADAGSGSFLSWGRRDCYRTDKVCHDG